MGGFEEGHQYKYLTRIGYDKFEDRVYLSYGNGTETVYNYEPDRRRLEHITAFTLANRKMVDNIYSYDDVNNITGWQSTRNNQRRNILWDEENRMRALSNNGQIRKYFRENDGLVNPGTQQPHDTTPSPGNKPEYPPFYYHPDHLGSSSYITDVSGEIYQHNLCRSTFCRVLQVDERSKTASQNTRRYRIHQVPVQRERAGCLPD